MEKQTLGWLGYFRLHFLPSSVAWGLMAGPKFPYRVVAQQGRIIPFSSMAAYHAVVIVPWSPELCMLRHLFKMRMPLLVPELSLLRNLVHVANMRLMPYPYNVCLGGVADFGGLVICYFESLFFREGHHLSERWLWGPPLETLLSNCFCCSSALFGPSDRSNIPIPTDIPAFIPPSFDLGIAEVWPQQQSRFRCRSASLWPFWRHGPTSIGCTRDTSPCILGGVLRATWLWSCWYPFIWVNWNRNLAKEYQKCWIVSECS